MQPDVTRIRENVAKAATEDLLDRATVYRTGMEPAALEIIEGELRRRGVTPGDIQAHWEIKRANVLTTGLIARKCSQCDRPAVCRRWGVHWFWGKIPTFIPRLYYLCQEHAGSR
jgi:hypothetical protein